MAGRMSMAAFMLGWAGLSVHCQVLAFLGDSGLSMGTYLTGKLLHGGLSALLLRLLLPLLGGSIGALLGMRTFRHKTKHWYFVWGIPAILLAQIALAAWLLYR